GVGCSWQHGGSGFGWRGRTRVEAHGYGVPVPPEGDCSCMIGGMSTHLDDKNQPAMGDVGEKAGTLRTAGAEARVTLPAGAVAAMAGGDIATKKGPVFQTAVLAGTMGAKRTADLIPLCHPLPLEDCKISIALEGHIAVI